MTTLERLGRNSKTASQASGMSLHAIDFRQKRSKIVTTSNLRNLRSRRCYLYFPRVIRIGRLRGPGHFRQARVYLTGHSAKSLLSAPGPASSRPNCKTTGLWPWALTTVRLAPSALCDGIYTKYVRMIFAKLQVSSPGPAVGVHSSNAQEKSQRLHLALEGSRQPCGATANQ